MTTQSSTLALPQRSRIVHSRWRARFSRIMLWLVALGVMASAVYALVIRPWHLRWGATDAEVSMALPGDELVPNATEQRTRAVTIHASAEQVFPWLRQLGWERGGLYSYDWLENLAGLGFVNADRIHPEWQTTQVGELVSMGPPGKAPPPYVVAQVVPNRAFVVGHRRDDGKGWVDSWQFVLNPIDAQTTRLLLRSRASFNDAMLNTIMTAIEPGVFVMERGMLLGIKERIEKRQ